MDSRRGMPEHLLFEILLWLPVTSLLRFKSVCKSWYTLIDSPIFLSQHFDHNSGNDKLLGVCNYNVDDGWKKVCVISDNKYEVYDNFDCGQPCHVVEEPNQAFSSNGIICLVDCSRNVSLWNPAMKQLKSLARSSVLCQDNVHPFCGFGFNVKSNDHKFVRTTLCNGNSSKNLVEVYSLRADSWRTTHNDFAMPSRFYNSLNCHITKAGTCFWIAYSKGDDDSDGNVILSFDLNEETFETMSLPVGEVNSSAVISFLGDKLAYIRGVDHHLYINGHSYYEIWILHEYGVKESWNKAWKIGPTSSLYCDDVLFPLRFILNGQFLLLTDRCSGRYSGIHSLYNLGSEENEYLQLHQPYLYFWWSVSYTESLFPVNHKQGGLAGTTLCPRF